MDTSKKPQTFSQMAERLLSQDGVTKSDLILLAEISDSEIQQLRREIESLRDTVTRLQG